MKSDLSMAQRFKSYNLKDLLRKTASRSHPAVRARILRLMNRRSGSKNHGLLSVVVPMYNVAEYLPTLLDSIVTQSYPYLEILLVDDGSTDETLSIARRYAQFDRRVRILELQHGGNGKARNFAVKHAAGQFLAFADADDFVPQGAYQTMVGNLAASGSDFVVGGHTRLQGGRRLRVAMSDTLHAERRIGISLHEMPEIIHDVFLWNKTYRLEFWRAKVEPIPENLLYEDQETTARAYVCASSFDVLPEEVYRWRIRADGSSITQGKQRLEDLRDRVQVIQDVTELLNQHAPESVQRQWFLRALGVDLLQYFEMVPRKDEEYWSLLRACVVWLSNQCAPYQIRELEVYPRLLILCAVANNRRDVETLVLDRVDHGSIYPVLAEEAGYFAGPEVLKQLHTKIGHDLLGVAPDHLKIRGSVSRVRRSADDGLAIEGFAFIEGLNHREFPRELSVSMVHGDGQETQLNAVRPWSCEQIDFAAPDPTASHADCGFSVGVPSAGRPLKLRLLVTQGSFAGSIIVDVPADEPEIHSKLRVSSFRLDAEQEKIFVELAIPPTNRREAESIPDVCLATTKFTLTHLESDVDHRKGTATVVFPLARDFWGDSTPAPPSGFYSLRSVKSAGGAGDHGSPIPITLEAAGALPSESLTRHAAVRAYRTESGHFAVRIGPPIAPEDRSRYGQQILRKRYSAGGHGLEKAMFFESFGGKSCTDSPRGISDALHDSAFEGKIYWSIIDHSVPVPAYAIPVVIGSPRWFHALETASVLVNNHNFPHFFRKRPGQRYVQTWHGTPLKKIGLDAPQHSISPSYRRLMSREAKQWDLLLAQNEHAVRVFPSAFGYDGRIASEGYPRNDSLVAHLSQKRDQIRDRIGLKFDQQAVLYAPTWRDNARNASDGNTTVSYLDLELARRSLGHSVVFLIRSHHNIVAERKDEFGSNAIDVTDYPEINELMVASDCLVTDYSSLMFDYSLTGKPIHLLAPDLADYREKVRGLYMGLDQVAPRPLHQNMKSLLVQLAHDPGVESSGAFGQPERQLRLSFAARDDGFAGERILKLIAEWYPSGIASKGRTQFLTPISTGSPSGWTDLGAAGSDQGKRS